MPRPSIHSIVLGFFFFVLLGCSRSSDFPTLSKPQKLPIEQVAIHEEIGSKEIRQIFHALNTNKRLGSLAPWIEESSDSDLSVWGSFITQNLYRSALDPDSLLQLVKTRAANHGFSKLHSKIQVPNGFVLVAYPFIKKTVAFEGLPFLLSSFSDFLEMPYRTELAKSLTTVDATGGLNWDSFSSELAFEVSRLPVAELDWSQVLTRSELVDNFFVLTQNLSQEVVSQNWESLRAQFSGFFAVPEKNPLRSAFNLVRLLDRSANKPLAALQVGLRKNQDVVKLALTELEPSFVNGIGGWLKYALQNPEDGSVWDGEFWKKLPRVSEPSAPTESFQVLFYNILSGLERVSNRARLEDGADTDFYRLPLILNSWVLTRWLEVWSVKNQALLLNRTRGLWDEKFEGVDLSLSLIVVEGEGKKKLNPDLERDLQSLGLDGFISKLSQWIQNDGFGYTDYRFKLAGQQKDLGSFLVAGVQTCHKVRPLADFVPTGMALLDLFLSSDSSFPWNLESLKKVPNLLTWFQEVLQGLNPQDWAALRRVLFDQLHFDNLSPDTKKLILDLFASDAKEMEWADKILKELPGVLLTDKGEGLTPFGLYHRYLRSSRVSALSALTQVLSGVVRTGVLDLENGTAKYPSLNEWLAKTAFPITFLRVGTEWGAGFRQKLRGKAMEISVRQDELGRTSLEVFLTYLRFVKESPEALTALLKGLGKRAEGSTSLEFSDSEWIGLTKILSSPSFGPWLGLLQQSTSQGLWLGVLKDLDGLTSSGDFEHVLRLLGQIQDDRLREAARVGLLWRLSGEWNAFLSFLKVLVHGP